MPDAVRTIGKLLAFPGLLGWALAGFIYWLASLASLHILQLLTTAHCPCFCTASVTLSLAVMEEASLASTAEACAQDTFKKESTWLVSIILVSS